MTEQNSVESMIVFEVIGDRPVAQLPLGGASPDGLRLLTPAQCVQRFGRTEQAWRDEWHAIWDRYVSMLDPTAPSDATVRAAATVAGWDIVRAVKFPHLNDAQWSYVREDCLRRRIDPRDVEVHLRTGEAGGRAEPLIITTIKVFRQVADRTGLRQHETSPEFCGADGVWVPSPWVRPEPPEAARVFITRKDRPERIEGIAYWKFCARYTRDERGTLVLTECWEKGGAHMLGKCAAAAGYRVAFSEKFGGLYTSDELPAGPLAADRVASLSPADRVDAGVNSSAGGAGAEGVGRSPAARDEGGVPDDPKAVAQLVDDTTPDLPRLPIELIFTGAASTIDEARSLIRSSERRWPRLLSLYPKGFCAAVLHHARLQSMALN